MQRLIVCGFVMGLSLGCAGQSDGPLTWEEFQDQAYRGPDGVYVVNGDEPAENSDRLHEYYVHYLNSFEEMDGIGMTQQGLAINRFQGHDDKWSATAAQNLTYCVARSGPGSFTNPEYYATTLATGLAAVTWETHANVKFTHDLSQDDNCTTSNHNVLFPVQKTCQHAFLGRAFFPSTPIGQARSVLFDCDALNLDNSQPLSLLGVAIHEFGHVLGFRHEQTRPEAGQCFEDNNWRALTVYDSKSAMHYPWCNGTNTGDFALTALDKQGARLAYPGAD